MTRTNEDNIFAVIIIGTTIRMAVLQRSREIAIMRLVGATDGFIRLPMVKDRIKAAALLPSVKF